MHCVYVVSSIIHTGVFSFRGTKGTSQHNTAAAQYTLSNPPHIPLAVLLLFSPLFLFSSFFSNFSSSSSFSLILAFSSPPLRPHICKADYLSWPLSLSPLLSMKPCWHDKFISGVSSGPCQPAINKLHLKCHLVLLLLFLVLPLFLTFPPCILTLSLFSLLYLVPSLFSPHFLSAIHASFPFLSFISPFFFSLISFSPQASLTLSCSCRTLIVHHHKSHAHICTVEMCTISLRRGSACVLSLSSFKSFSPAQLEGQERGAQDPAATCRRTHGHS